MKLTPSDDVEQGHRTRSFESIRNQPVQVISFAKHPGEVRTFQVVHEEADQTTPHLLIVQVIDLIEKGCF